MIAGTSALYPVTDCALVLPAGVLLWKTKLKCGEKVKNALFNPDHSRNSTGGKLKIRKSHGSCGSKLLIA